MHLSGIVLYIILYAIIVILLLSLEFIDKFCNRCFGSITSIGLGVEKKVDGFNALC